jgi:hypothetical protein
MAGRLGEYSERGSVMRRLVSILAAVFVLLIVLAIVIAFVLREPATVGREDPHDVTINIPAFSEYGGVGNARQLDISPDGKKIVYVASVRGGSRQLLVQTIGETSEPAGIPGTSVGNFAIRDPTFSPDGRYVAYWTQGEVRKTTLDGTEVSVIGKAGATTRGIAWLDSDTLVLGNFEGPLMKLSASEKNALPLVKSAESKGSTLAHVGPYVLPGNKAVLYTTANGPLPNARIHVVILATGEQRQLFDENAFAPRYLPSGHIMFGRGYDRELMAVRFDLAKLEIVGSAQRVLRVPLSGTGPGGATDYAVSTTGVLVYTPRPEDGFYDALAWMGGVSDTQIHVRLNWFEALNRLVP